MIQKAEFRANIPSNFAGWVSRASGEIVLPRLDGSDELYQNLETRIYEGDGLPSIMLCIAYNNVQQNDTQLHRPEVCYPAAGFPIIENRPINLTLDNKTVAARELLADRSGLKERIIYWTRVGSAFPDSWEMQRLTMAISNLRGIIPDGALFRASTLEVEGSGQLESLIEFISLFLKATPNQFRDRVII